MDRRAVLHMHRAGRGVSAIRLTDLRVLRDAVDRYRLARTLGHGLIVLLLYDGPGSVVIHLHRLLSRCLVHHDSLIHRLASHGHVLHRHSSVGQLLDELGLVRSVVDHLHRPVGGAVVDHALHIGRSGRRGRHRVHLLQRSRRGAVHDGRRGVAERVVDKGSGRCLLRGTGGGRLVRWVVREIMSESNYEERRAQGNSLVPLIGEHRFVGRRHVLLFDMSVQPGQ